MPLTTLKYPVKICMEFLMEYFIQGISVWLHYISINSITHWWQKQETKVPIFQKNTRQYSYPSSLSCVKLHKQWSIKNIIIFSSTEGPCINRAKLFSQSQHHVTKKFNSYPICSYYAFPKQQIHILLRRDC